jgi:hypothetical protein
MFKRVPQPPVNPALRAVEHHDFWLGFVLAVAGLVLLYCGARHLTRVDTTDGDTAWETQLVRAYTSSGLKYAGQQAPAPPPKLDGVANPAEVLDRWARQQANAQPPSWKIRVDVGAKTPCPT